MSERKRYNEADRKAAVTLALEIGVPEASRRLGILGSTLRAWIAKAGLGSAPSEQSRAATEGHLASIAERKARIADKMLAEVERSLDDMHGSSMVYGNGKDGIVYREIPTPTARDRQALATVAAILTDKAQLLTGAPTARTEHAGDRVAAIAAKRDELAERRRSA